MTHKELAASLEAKRNELAALFDKHKTEAGDYDMPVEVIEEVNKRNDDLTEMGKQFDASYRALQAQEQIKRDAENASKVAMLPVAGRPAGDGEKRHIGAVDQMIELPEYKAFAQRVKDNGDFGRPGLRFDVTLDGLTLKTLMTTTTSYAPFVGRDDRLVLTAQRRPVVADLIPDDETDAGSVKWMEETTFTNAAAPVVEGGAYPEAALVYTERTTPVEKIAVWIPATDEQLADVGQLRNLIENRLRLMLQLAEENQLLTGTGVSPQLTGFLNKAGIQTQAKGTDPIPDAIFKAMTKVRWTAFAEPTGLVIHPNDWQSVRLLRTNDGNYIWGHPAEQGPERIWAMPIVPTPAITEGTALTGDFQMFSHISRRKGISFSSSDSHGTFFIEGKVAIRAEERLSLEIYRAAAFATITGLNA